MSANFPTKRIVAISGVVLILITALPVGILVKNRKLPFMKKVKEVTAPAVESKQVSAVQDNDEDYTEPSNEDSVPVKEVEIKDSKLSPNLLKVKIGDRVKWKNNDQVPHTVKADELSIFDSGEILPGEDVTPVRFREGGTYSYHLENGEKGTVVAE